MKKSIINTISANEALTILKRLSTDSPEMKKRIEEFALEVLQTVDIEEVCQSVFSALDVLDTDELFSRSGKHSYGYTPPEEAVIEMVEETLQPFEEEVYRYIDLKMENEAKLYCMGVLKGIYKFENEANSEFSDWAVDVPIECFGYLFDRWKEKTKNKEFHSQMIDFIKTECPEWAE